MALQGTIDTFPLTDVLALLASSKKTGRLALDGDRGRAALWITDGEVVGGDMLGAAGDSAASLLFELLRFDEASFAFEVTEGAPEHAVAATSIETGLREASALLAEWDDIVAVVPSLAHRVVLQAELPEDTVTLDATTWALVLAAATDPVVAAVGDSLGLDEFGACAAVASLVDQGLATIAVPAAFDPSRKVARPVDEADPFEDVAPPEDAVEPSDEVDATDEPGMADDEPSIDLADALATAGRSDERSEPEFPERFPIDDLLGGGADQDDDVWSSPEMERLNAQRQATDAAFEGVSFDGGAFDDSAFDAGAGEPAFDGLPPLSGSSPEPAAPATGPDAWDDLLPDDGDEDDSTDEVLRQMSKLSPQAAEAIAAALNSVPAPAPEAPAPSSEGDGDGPVTFSGMF